MTDTIKAKVRTKVKSSIQLFLGYLLTVLIPVFILAILGLVAIFYTRAATEEQLSVLHEGILAQIEQSIEYFFSEVDATTVAISSSTQFLIELQNVLQQERANFTSFQTVTLLQGIINPSIYARNALHSLYVIFDNNTQAIFTSEFGIISLQDIPDRTWIEGWRNLASIEDSRTEVRTFQPLSNTLQGSEQVITISRRIAPLGRTWMRGAVILNVSMRSLHDLVKSRLTHPGQVLLIESPRGIMIYGSQPKDLEDYQLSVRRSSTDWLYSLYTPKEVFNGPAIQIFRITGSIVLGATLIGIIIAIFFTRRHFRYIQEVMTIIDLAEEGSGLPSLPPQPPGGFHLITYNILKTFLDKQYLEVQLSERAFRERTLELLFLQSQLNPHFLFNTLEVLNWKILEYTKKPTDINQIVNRLSRILQYSLAGPRKLVTLGEEIENGKDYLSIQQYRYGNRLQQQWNIDPNTLHCPMIPMVIQPLLENAIYHGIRHCEEGGVIYVESQIVDLGRFLEIKIGDNGIGIDNHGLEELRTKLQYPSEEFNEHVGLVNSRRRLELAFPDQIDVQVGPWLMDTGDTINSHNPGFLVIIRMPYRVLSSEASSE